MAPHRSASVGVEAPHSAAITVFTYCRNGTTCTVPAAPPLVRSTRIVSGGAMLLGQPVHVPDAAAALGALAGGTPPRHATTSARAERERSVRDASLARTAARRPSGRLTRAKPLASTRPAPPPCAWPGDYRTVKGTLATGRWPN